MKQIKSSCSWKKIDRVVGAQNNMKCKWLDIEENKKTDDEALAVFVNTYMQMKKYMAWRNDRRAKSDSQSNKIKTSWKLSSTLKWSECSVKLKLLSPNKMWKSLWV